MQENPEVDVINVHVPYEGHIDGTDAFVDFERILEYGGLPENRSVPVALYCRSGSMSGTAAQDLAEAGFTNIVDLNGGMNAWTSSGRELLLDEPT
ncbi:MAG: rhodanese-like domain-containing protein [Acidimicrobiia bacterium]|nr:rhodanese-like domain-containing protein [Acidimicrobiia bacterium]